MLPAPLSKNDSRRTDRTVRKRKGPVWTVYGEEPEISISPRWITASQKEVQSEQSLNGKSVIHGPKLNHEFGDLDFPQSKLLDLLGDYELNPTDARYPSQDILRIRKNPQP